MDASMQAMDDALVNNMGATNTSRQNSDEVDLVAVYMSAITSSLQALDQRITGLSTTSTSLSRAVTSTFGDEAEAQEATKELDITTAFQGLVTDFSYMVANLSSLADQAAAKFDQQAAAAANLSAAITDTITSMRDSAALAEALQHKYVEQTLMLDAATGAATGEWSCNRTKLWKPAFSVDRSAEVSTTSGRRLLAFGTAVEDVTVIEDQTLLWQGYQIPVAAKEKNWVVDVTDAPEPARYAGAAIGHNRVIAGLYLHTIRRTSNAECSGTGFRALFDFSCQRSAVPLARNASVVNQYLAHLFAGDTNDVYPYGVDPAFLRSSASLYRPELQGKEAWFYNTSDPVEVSPITGTPYGFFHQPVKGYPRGFPVLLPNKLSQARSASALQYLIDGNYLDTKSKHMTVELLTLNADLQVLGYTQLIFDWKKDGAIQGFVDVQAVPAVHLAAEGGLSHIAGWLVPLWLLCAAFWVTAVLEANKLLAHSEGKHWFPVSDQGL
eukprot:GHRR01030295.1.p1 GENE.GHRR01030295.1~~GHRR01030295.1.p1  ORF type:complete len:524 (+),score=176.95 GHRR01030295.1:86-1573(+)